MGSLGTEPELSLEVAYLTASSETEPATPDSFLDRTFAAVIRQHLTLVVNATSLSIEIRYRLWPSSIYPLDIVVAKPMRDRSGLLEQFVDGG